MDSKYIVFSYLNDSTLHTFLAETEEEFNMLLKMCVSNWCHNPNVNWRDGRPGVKVLLKECIKDKDFGEILSAFQYDPETRGYIRVY